MQSTTARPGRRPGDAHEFSGMSRPLETTVISLHGDCHDGAMNTKKRPTRRHRDLKRTRAADQQCAGLQHESHERRCRPAQSWRRRDRGRLAAADRAGALLAHQLPRKFRFDVERCAAVLIERGAGNGSSAGAGETAVEVSNVRSSRPANDPKPVSRVAPKQPDGEPSLLFFHFYEAAVHGLTHPAMSGRSNLRP